ncbi:MAG: CHASE2 domain-containing protein [Legionella sp.]
MKKLFLKSKTAILLGLLIVTLISWVDISHIGWVEKIVAGINNNFYDLLLRSSLKKLPPIKNNNIAIIAIDDKSIADVGRWPWSRKTIAHLVEKLHKLEVGVIAFDIVFSEPQRNIINEAISELDQLNDKSKTSLRPALQQLRPLFNYDDQFSDALKVGDNVLGMVFNAQSVPPIGQLPPSLLPFNHANNSYIPYMKSYLANISPLQEAAGHGGFINADADSDGTLRYANLVVNYQNQLYPSLELAAVRLFLLNDKIELVTTRYPDKETTLEGIQMDETIIPTDERGRVLIPFRVGPYAFPYFSASEILNNQISKDQLAGKLVFIGATATGLGDLKPTAIANNYPGVEVHASIASGILDKYFPSKPLWGKSLEFFLIIGLGLLAALLFPLLSATWLATIALLTIGFWFFVTHWLWINHSLVLSMLFPLLTVLLLVFINMVNSYLVANRQRKEIKSVFGQYVPQKHIDAILQSSDESLMDGESKELTVLFSDIRGFTTMSEKMSATELKMQLNEYLTAMTGVIFNLGGTIDKYVGDMIMAFWNAPLPDGEHAKKCVLAGLLMQRELAKVNTYFTGKNLPPIAIGVGINSGLINVGDMGSKYRRAYTAIGDSVNLASRLEGMCRQYEVDILVGEETYKATQDQFLYMHVDKVKVKGKHQGVDIYLPLGLMTEVTASQRMEVEEYHQALDHYFKRNWQDAELNFAKLVASYPQRDLYKLYLERVKSYLLAPPANDWDGAYVSTTK